MKEKIYIKDFISLVTRHKKPIAIIITVSVLCFIQLSFILPKSFKSEFEFNIYPKYFYNALIADIVPGVSSTPEMTQTVESMVKEVINDKFIDELGIKFNIYSANLSQYELSQKRQMLRDQFELFSSGGNKYHVSFIHGDPQVTFAISEYVLAAVKSHFINTRIETIEIAQQTILKKLESANVTKSFSDSSSSGMTTKNPAVIIAEIAKINQEIASSKMQFNANHPIIVKLEQRKNTLEEWLREISPNEVDHKNTADNKDSKYAPLLMSNDKETSKGITAKLYSNFNNINIALDIERRSVASYIAVTDSPQFPTAALFPKKRLFASLGLIIGLVFCFIFVLYKEVMKAEPIEKAQEVALKFKGDYFGKLPIIDEATLMTNKALFLEDKSASFKLEYHASSSGSDSRD